MRVQSTLPGLDQAPRKPQGGYRLIPVWLVAAVWFAFLRGRLRIVDVRTFFACHEASARRCAVPSGTPQKFTHREILRLTGGTERRLKASLQRLEAVGLLTFSESEIHFASNRAELAIDLEEFQLFLDQFPNHKRLLPVPRRILRLLAGGARPSLIATILGHLIWGLYRTKQGGFNPSGRVKASWIAETFGVSLRRVKQARQELIELGWVSPEEAKQWEHNRWGWKFRINLAWKRAAAADIISAPVGPPIQPPAPPMETVSPVPVPVPVADGQAEPSGTKLAPPPAVSGTKLAPPIETRNSSYGRLKNQEPASGGPAGVKISESKETGAGESKPTLKHIVPQDLRETARLLELHAQAVDSGLLGSSECDQLHFFAAAEHARVIGTENPCGLFARLVRSQLWHYLTQDDEDTANRRLKDFLHVVPMEFAGGLIAKPAPVKEPELSEDARLVRAVKAALLKAGYRGDPFPQFRREKPEWTRERWDQAVRELERQDSRRKSMTSVGELLNLEENL